MSNTLGEGSALGAELNASAVKPDVFSNDGFALFKGGESGGVLIVQIIAVLFSGHL